MAQIINLGPGLPSYPHRLALAFDARGDPNQNGNGSRDRSGDRLEIDPENVVSLGIKQSLSLTEGIDG
jgi:hypothetical protein